ncbi:MAG: hypothetical protein LC634_02385 [Sphingomonadales bacterium]|nr:hypothetical protein [Sphingomonadales bacterium]
MNRFLAIAGTMVLMTGCAEAETEDAAADTDSAVEDMAAETDAAVDDMIADEQGPVAEARDDPGEWPEDEAADEEAEVDAEM